MDAGKGGMEEEAGCRGRREGLDGLRQGPCTNTDPN